MTPREADRIIKAGKPVLVTTPLDREPFTVTLVSRDRWNVRTAEGGVFDRGDMRVVGVAYVPVEVRYPAAGEVLAPGLR